MYGFIHHHGPRTLGARGVPASPKRRAGVTEPLGRAFSGKRSARSRSRLDFDALFQHWYPPLVRYLHGLTGDADLADDLAQESFVRLLRQTMPEEEAKLWLFTVATNLVRDGARQTSRRQRLLTLVPVWGSDAPLADEEMEHAERAQRVRAALDRLAARDQQILLMRQEGFRYAEIARATGVAPGSVGTLLARALRRFATVYREEEG